MAYLLGYGTAVEWLRRNPSPELLLKRYELPPLGIEASRTRLQQHEDKTRGLTRPLHLVVTSREDRRPSGDTICHLFSSVAGGYPAARIDRGIFCCGPELAFIQMARFLDIERLMMLGMELCGRFGINQDGELFKRPQTCSPEYLVQTAQKFKRMRGKKNALMVAPRLMGGAASPMEAALALILHEPPERNGFGLPEPELNKSLPVTGIAQRMWGDDFITPDLLWDDAHLAIEYDSDAFHTASHRIANDARRRDLLIELGYRVITVTTEHMKSAHEIERVATLVAKHLGQDLPDLADADWAERAKFQARLFGIASNPDELLGFEKFPHKSQRAWSTQKYRPSNSVENTNG